MLLTAVTTEDEPDNTRKEIKALEEDTTALDASFAGAAARSGDAGAPTDWLVLSVFFLQGVGQLFPWNVFINAESYFARRLCGTPFAANFESWFGVGYNVAAVAGLIIALRYALPQRLKILGGLAVSALVFGACVLLVFDAAMDGAVLFALTMALVCASAVAVAFAQSGLFGLASGYPPEHTQAMMSGQGVAGLIVAVTNYIAVASQPEPPLPKDCSDPARGAVSMPLPAATSAGADDCVPYEFDGGTAAYFAVATATLVACVGGYLLLEARRGSSGGGVGGGGMCELNDSGHRRRQRRGDAGVDGGGGGSGGSGSDEHRYTLVSPLVDGAPEAHLYDVSFDGDGGGGSGDKGANTALAAVRAVLPLALSVCGVFAVTLAVFPSTTARLRSTRACDAAAPRWRRGLFVPASFILFNAADLAGRLCARAPLVRAARLPAAAAARAALLPLLLACGARRSRWRRPPLASSDAWPVLLVAALGVSNGYLGSRCMMAAPAAAPPRLRELAGTAMVLFLMLGLLAGALASFGVLLFATGSAG